MRNIRTIKPRVNGNYAQTACAKLPHDKHMPRIREAGAAAKKLKALRERARLSVREMQEKLGIAASSTYAGWENEYKKPYLAFDRAEKVAKALVGLGEPPITREEVMALAGVSRGAPRQEEPDLPLDQPRPAIMIPEYDVRPQAGGGADGEDGEMIRNGGEWPEHARAATWSIPGDYLRAFASEPAAVRIVRVAGDSMEPDYPSGERVAVDTGHTIPSPPGVYVVFDGFGLVLKRIEVVLGSSPPMVRLMNINPAYATYERPLADVRIQGRVIGKWMWK